MKRTTSNGYTVEAVKFSGSQYLKPGWSIKILKDGSILGWVIDFNLPNNIKLVPGKGARLNRFKALALVWLISQILDGAEPINFLRREE